jgi:hypothetical protein
MDEQLIAELDENVVFLDPGFSGGAVSLDENDYETIAVLEAEL